MLHKIGFGHERDRPDNFKLRVSRTVYSNHNQETPIQLLRTDSVFVVSIVDIPAGTTLLNKALYAVVWMDDDLSPDDMRLNNLASVKVSAEFCENMDQVKMVVNQLYQNFKDEVDNRSRNKWKNYEVDLDDPVLIGFDVSQFIQNELARNAIKRTQVLGQIRAKEPRNRHIWN